MKPSPLPSLYCPFRPAIHADAEQCNNRTRAWLSSTGLVRHPAGADRAAAARFGWLAARAYPWSSPEGLQLASDWATWLFMRDDLCDEGGLRADPMAMRRHCDAMIRILLEGPTVSGGSDPHATALADLRARIMRLGGYERLGRFVGPMVDYFEACVWEAENRAAVAVPTIPEYIAMRRHTGGVMTCLAIADVIDGIRPSLADQQDPRVRRLIEIANDAICWSNDIFSAEKEMFQGDVHNLVLVVKHARDCDLETAIEYVAHMHDAIIREFELVEAGLDPDPPLRRFVTALATWVRANLDWSIESGRYRAPMARKIA
jgi:5-epi-alpha-selinene synthase